MSISERLPLTRQRVADAALALIDESGLDDLSMRKLGAALGVEAMSLYNHVENKADLLRGVTDTLFAEVVATYGETDGDWKQRARALSYAYMSVAERHPRALLLIISSPDDAAQEVEFHDRIAVTGQLFTDDLHTVALAFSVVGNWVVGTLVERFGLIARPDDEEIAPLNDVTAGHDDVVAFRAESAQLSAEEKFAEGLEIVLAGIEARFLSR